MVVVNLAKLYSNFEIDAAEVECHATEIAWKIQKRRKSAELDRRETAVAECFHLKLNISHVTFESHISLRISVS